MLENCRRTPIGVLSDPLHLIHHETGFKADVYLAGRDPLHGWAMAHRRRAGSGAGQFWVAPAEYVILRKLAWYREGGSQKHLRDIRSMLAVTGPALDLAMLHRWLGTLGLEAEWQAANVAPLVS